MNGVSASEQEDYSEEEGFVEVDPTGRYGRYNEILGKGASKTVYRGFDEYEGIEVAWNQVKLHDFLQKPEDLEMLYCEIHLLKNLKHNNIMEFYSSWVDAENRNINFVTEMFTSGTLRQYRLKHKRVNIRAVKHWCRQILKGLHYLHSLNPPVIHRDLKCDNIFVNGNQGQVKIGDLGLAAMMRKSHDEHCVGTPEFMAPEVYEEEYNELVDIYAFGMCILEMVTFEYPYSECTHAAQIYKKVISGQKPDSLYKVEDAEVRLFVEKCLATVSRRLTARELLDDPFLRIDDQSYSLRSSESDEMSPFLVHQSYRSFEDDHEATEIDLFSSRDEDDDQQFRDDDIVIQGRRREDNDIFLRLRIADKEGRIRNIYFPFDIGSDTALSVATEMVNELDITDQDVTRIANMIDGDISSLVPDWRSGFGSDDHKPDRSNGPPLLDHVASENLGVKPGSAEVHGRFEEITYQEANVVQFTDIWAQRDGQESGLEDGPREKIIENKKARCHSRSISLGGGHKNLIRQELRWLKAKYQLQMRELRDQEARLDREPSISPDLDRDDDESLTSLGSALLKEGLERPALKYSSSFKCFGSDLEAKNGLNNGFYSRDYLPQPLHRATSLPVDAIDF